MPPLSKLIIMLITGISNLEKLAFDDNGTSNKLHLIRRTCCGGNIMFPEESYKISIDEFVRFHVPQFSHDESPHFWTCTR